MEPTTQRLMGGAAGASEKKYLDEVFSTCVYNGTGSTQTITNNIDVVGEGGMTWLKKRSGTSFHYIYDSLRTTSTTNSNSVDSSRSNAQMNTYDGLDQFTSSGFVVNTLGAVNGSGDKQVSWTFRKAKGFFDVVTYTGNGNTSQEIPHDLGSVPGCVMVKCTSETMSWAVYHRITGNTKALYLNGSSGGDTSSGFWNNTSPTETHFTVSGSDPGAFNTNKTDATYVAYVFAHDDQSFGEGGDQSIVYCGSYTGNGNTTGPTITLGWDPQFIIIKRVGQEGWVMFDSMRGLHAGGDDKALFPNQDTVEQNRPAGNVWPLGGGFRMHGSTDTKVNANGDEYIFIAVRALSGAVSKPPTLGTDVFNMIAGTSNSDVPTFVSGFPTDYSFIKNPAGSGDWYSQARMTGTGYTIVNSTAAEASSTPNTWDFMNGWYSSTGNLSNYQSWDWKRGSGFDVVNYIGNGSDRYISHGLGVAPEMMWFKKRNASKNWYVYHIGINGGVNPENYSLRLNTTAAQDEDGNTLWNQTAPTATQFRINTDNGVNNNNDTYIAFLFASVDGISKVGYYDGSNSEQTITTGFQPRFVILKNVNSGGDWYVLDTVRGWASGNESYLLLQSGVAQYTDHDFGAPTATGFTLTSLSSYNGAGGKYIYYAHA